MRIVYSSRARADLEHIGEYLSRRNEQAAVQVRIAIRSTIARVAKHPFSGRLQDTGVRKLVVLPYGYLIYYNVNTKGIEIVTITHPSQERQFNDQ